MIEKPLTTEELVTRYRAMSEDPCFANVPGKIELDGWGRILMTPPSFYTVSSQAGLCASWQRRSAAPDSP